MWWSCGCRRKTRPVPQPIKKKKKKGTYKPVTCQVHPSILMGCDMDEEFPSPYLGTGAGIWSTSGMR